MEHAFEVETEVDKIKRILFSISFTSDDLTVANGSVLLTASGFNKAVVKAQEIRKSGLQVYQSAGGPRVSTPSVGLAQKRKKKRKT
jgi:hypothetical protein